MFVVSEGDHGLHFCIIYCLLGEIMISKAPLYYKLYQLIKQLYRIAHNMPREYKYELGRDILHLAWDCLDLFFEANNASGELKYGRVKELSVNFDKLKLRIRLAQEIGLMSEGQFSSLQENYLSPSGKMIGGWLNWSK